METAEHPLKYLGLETHVVSLVDRHESNGVERVIREALRRLSALVSEERIRTRRAKKTTIKCIESILNNSPLSEKGMYTAYTLMYGTGNGASDILQSIPKVVQDELYAFYSPGFLCPFCSYPSPFSANLKSILINSL